MKKFIIGLAGVGCLVAGTAFAGGATHWGYTGHEGPEYWGDLSSKFTACKAGRNQSPINISSTIEADLPAINFHYSDSGLKIVNNGHTIKVDYDTGSSISVDGHTYNLVQFHFHTPSENIIEGKAFPMEAHFVHADKDGNLAVVGVMMEKGAESKSIANVWNIMPTSADKTVEADGTLNANDFLPANKDYYRFDGSLTTPPCSEGVVWMVMKDSVSVSGAQVEKFSKLFHGNNARPVQPVNARTVLK